MPRARILVFGGSIRTGSYSGKLAALAAKELTLLDAVVSHISLADYPMPIYDADVEARDGQPNTAKKLHELMLSHRGVFIATPEYNASIPPLLKNTIDWVSRVKGTGDPFKHCTFLLGSTSNRPYGGIRAMMTLRQVLEFGLGALVLPNGVVVGHASQVFDEQGDLTDAAAAKVLRSGLMRLIAFAEADL